MELTADRLGNILDSAIVAISSIQFFPDQTWEYIYWSSGCERIFGFTAAALLADQRLWVERIPADDWQRIITPAFGSIFSQPHPTFTYRFHHPNGSLRWISATQTVSWDEPTQSWMVTIVANDITEQQGIKESLKFQGNLLNQVQNAIICTNIKGEITYWNAAAEALYQWQSTEVMGRLLLEVITAPQDRDPFIHGFAELMTVGFKEGEYQLQRKDGSRFIAYARTIALQNDQNEITGFVGVSLDITERKATELALQQLNTELEQRVQQRTQELANSEQDLRTIFNNVYDAIFIHDLHGTVVDMNERALALFAAQRDQLLGLKAIDLCTSDWLPQAFSANLACLEAGETLQFEGRGQRFRDHFIFDVEVSLRLVTLSNCPVVIAGVRDISERKRAEAQIQASLKQKDLLLREIHHRIKNNLQVVSSLLMLQAETTDDIYTQQVLQESQERVMAIALVHEALYKSDTLERIDLSEYIQDLLEEIFYSHHARQRGIQLGLELESIWLNLETVLPCALILNELVVNALKHGFPDRASGQIYVSLHCQGETIILVVADDGIGLSTDWDVRQSLSLGLQLVRDLTQQLEGTLEISSDPSHHPGTRVTLQFQELFYRSRV
uniref:Signal transduction histidine kinase n=1 Tax=Cyanothece sp. (strain PCC 7425 / ATCC 29141) TaxID=395961 RepID=B8HUL4_CYAP4